MTKFLEMDFSKILYVLAGAAHHDRGGEAVRQGVLHCGAGQERVPHHRDHHQDGRLPVHLRQLHQVRYLPKQPFWDRQCFRFLLILGSILVGSVFGPDLIY